MTEDKNERLKKAEENFEKLLPQLWDKAKENEIELKSEYIKTLQTKLLNEIKLQIPEPSYQMWFSTLTIIDIIDGLEVVFEAKPTIDLEIVFGTNTTIGKEWLEVHYESMIRTILKTITNVDYKASFVLRSKEDRNRIGDNLFEIEECFGCGCQSLLRKNIEIPFEVLNIVSLTVVGLQCPDCGEEYYSDTINEVISLFKRREHERQIKPTHTMRRVPRV